jgi:hypothetical protein
MALSAPIHPGQANRKSKIKIAVKVRMILKNNSKSNNLKMSVVLFNKKNVMIMIVIISKSLTLFAKFKLYKLKKPQGADHLLTQIDACTLRKSTTP